MLLFRQSDLQFLSTLSLRRATGGKQSFIRMDRIFLSTLSLRRATLSALVLQVIPVDFYPRSPCGERPRQWQGSGAGCCISIHALLAESDTGGFNLQTGDKAFLSTLSLRRATPSLYQLYDTYAISIHALLAESDTYHFMPNIGTLHFYPRSPCGERRKCEYRPTKFYYFYPRSPCGERQQAQGLKITAHGISIHALLAESDVMPEEDMILEEHFYPRSPCGERLARVGWLQVVHYFYPRSPCGERPIAGRITSNGTKISIHALLAESDYRL